MSDEPITRVLCVEDDPFDRQLIQHALEKEATGFEVFVAPDRQAFERALEEGGFDVVITDFNILGFEGLEVIRVVRERYPAVPIILLTGTGSEEIAVQALKSGADDYVVKTPRHIARLPHTIRQVVEAHRTREELRESQERYRRLAENAPDVIYRFRLWPEEGFEYINPTIEKVTGYTPEEFYADPELGRKIVHPEDLPKLKSVRQETEQFGKPLELRWIRKDGAVVWAEQIDRPIYDEQGRLVAIEGIARNITARKQAEEALRTSEERLRAVTEAARDAIIMVDDEGQITFWNAAAERLFGYTREEATGQNVHELLAPERYRPEWESAFSQFSRTGRGNAIGTILEVYGQARSGEEIPVELSLAGLQVEGRWHAVAVVRDIRERKRAEEERQKLQEQLLQAQKLESVGRLAGGIAHDFNNVLSIILGYSQTMLNDLPAGHPMRADLEEIINAAQRAASLTRQLLAFSRKQTLQPEVLDLNEVLRNLSKMLRRLIGEDIQLELSLAEDLAPIEADRAQIEQVVMNLAVNARDAMPEGGKLTIETANVVLDETYARSHAGVKPGDYVMLAMTDTGHGMDKETLEHIFEPFFTTKDKDKGTGLGLATVYGIVKQSGGNIWVYSEPGRGTTFKIYLPQAEEKEVRREIPAERVQAAAGPARILVVEDEEALRHLMERILGKFGYEVAVARDGRDALRLVEEEGLKPDLVITDVVMPDMGGPKLIERLRAIQPDLKVLYMSGYTDNSVVHHGVLDPGTPFIQKPFPIEALAAKIREILGGAGSGTS